MGIIIGQRPTRYDFVGKAYDPPQGYNFPDKELGSGILNAKITLPNDPERATTRTRTLKPDNPHSFDTIARVNNEHGRCPTFVGQSNGFRRSCLTS
jgi:hypothetical protein